jgi:hypothetical protein
MIAHYAQICSPSYASRSYKEKKNLHLHQFWYIYNDIFAIHKTNNRNNFALDFFQSIEIEPIDTLPESTKHIFNKF